MHIPNLEVARGECAAVVGPSGSGKTTLLGLMAGILKPVSGALRVAGTDLASLDEKARRRFRIDRIGQVFQAFELLQYLTVIENVMLGKSRIKEMMTPIEVANMIIFGFCFDFSK